jgi:hypothetical protein
VITSQWARLRAEATVPLRRGAWYRVLRRTNSDAVLSVNQRLVNVPIGVLQLSSRPPTSWAVVPRAPSARLLPHNWGPRYAVCPQCNARAPLAKGPVSMRCPACNGVFDVGWGDAYYA